MNFLEAAAGAAPEGYVGSFDFFHYLLDLIYLSVELRDSSLMSIL